MASALVTHPTRLRWQGVLVWLVASAAAGLCVALSLRAARADGGFPAPGQETLLLGIALFAATQGVLWLAFLHRRAAGRLHAAEAVIAALLRHTGTAVFSTGPDGVIRTFNAEAERLLGWTAQEVAGVRRPDFFHDRAELAARAKRVGEKLQREIEPGFDALVAGGADGEEEECILLRKDGTRVPVRLALSALRDRHGRLEGWLGLATDITAQRRSEQVLREASDAAQESARVKSRFLANMSHEIRTPMNGVVGMTGLLLDTDLSPEQRGLAETVRASADALLTIINDILDFSKIEAGQLAFEELPFDLREPIENCLALVAGKAHEKNLELAYLVEENVPAQLVGDSGRLHQVLLNLVSNAVKFTERGEVVVRVARERERDRRVLLRFSVRDTGIGIPTNVQRRLFQPFVQADGSTTRRFGGTGLGLAICRQLVGLMHGQIGLDSAPDLGSLFWFTA